MLIKHFTCVISIILLPILLNAQDDFTPQLMEVNKVRISEGYFINELSPPDTVLISKHYFNAKGRKARTQIYDSLGLRSTYEYIYKNDTIRTERYTYWRGKLISTTQLFYNHQNQEIATIDYGENGRPSGWKSETKYNGSGDKTEHKVFIHEKVVSREKYWHDKNGRLEKFKLIKPKKAAETIYYNSDGSVKKRKSKNKIITENLTAQQNEYYRVVRTTRSFVYDRGILSVKGFIDIHAGDLYTSVKYYLENGLLDHQVDYINKKKIGIKKYSYTFQK